MLALLYLATCALSKLLAAFYLSKCLGFMNLRITRLKKLELLQRASITRKEELQQH